MTFKQYLEGRRSFVTRDPRYDINLAADFSDDEQDSSHFILPFLKKIKAFYWWCRVAEEELETNRFSPSNSRYQQSQPRRTFARTTALHGLVGHDNQDRYYVPNIKMHIQDVRFDLYYLYKAVEGNSGQAEKWLENSILSIGETLGISDHQHDDNDVIDKIKTRLRRMQSFLQAAAPQLKRVINIKSSRRPWDIHTLRKPS